jgi:hypothetical protein
MFNISLILLILLLNYISCTFVRNLLHKKSHKSNRSTGSTTEDKKIIVQTHNKLRNDIALSLNKNSPKLPFASNMIQMYYSDAVEKKAQAWTDRKKFMHSSYAYRKQPDFGCGENIYMSMMSGGKPKRNWEKAIKAWYGEIKDMGGKSVDSFASGGPVTGHFTQVIWAHSYIVGCGHIQFMDAGWITQIYLCQYGPVANIIGMPVYKSSKTKGCKCDAGLTCGNLTYPGLCCAKDKCKADILDWSGKPYEGTNPNI